MRYSWDTTGIESCSMIGYPNNPLKIPKTKIWTNPFFVSYLNFQLCIWTSKDPVFQCLEAVLHIPRSLGCPKEYSFRGPRGIPAVPFHASKSHWDFFDLELCIVVSYFNILGPTVALTLINPCTHLWVSTCWDWNELSYHIGLQFHTNGTQQFINEYALSSEATKACS